MNIVGFHHVAIICSDYERSKHFYTRVLGLPVIAETHRVERRSYKLDLRIPGGGQIELFSFPNPPARPTYPEARGLRHLALTVADIDSAVSELEKAGVKVEPVRVDELTGKRYTFFADPDDLPIEVYEERPEAFTLSHFAADQAQRSFRVVAKILLARLPYAEIEHVGSTAIPGCLTKGDLDVLVRVSGPDFERAALTLDGMPLAPSTRNERTAEYAEYDYSDGGISAAVQLAVAGSHLDDCFHGLKALLKSNPAALTAYNSLKAAHNGGGMATYREEKEPLIESLVAKHLDASGSGCTFLTPGIYE